MRLVILHLQLPTLGPDMSRAALATVTLFFMFREDRIMLVICRHGNRDIETSNFTKKPNLVDELCLRLPGLAPHPAEDEVGPLPLLEELELVPGLLQHPGQHRQLGASVIRLVGSWCNSVKTTLVKVSEHILYLPKVSSPKG